MDLRGSYNLVNQTEKPSSGYMCISILVSMPVRWLSVGQPSRRWWMLNRLPNLQRWNFRLTPGDSTLLAFDVVFQPRGFRNKETKQASSATVLTSTGTGCRSLAISLALELSDDEARQRLGLEPQPPMPSPDDPEARRYRWGIRGTPTCQRRCNRGYGH